jgi:hypothetical protein
MSEKNRRLFQKTLIVGALISYTAEEKGERKECHLRKQYPY